MRRVSAASVLHSQAVARRVGLSPADLECLDLIQMEGAATAGQIGRRTGLTSGAVTGLIDRLEGLGLVRRAADPSDRRKVLVQAVPERLAEIEALYAPMQEMMGALLAQYDEAFLDRVAEFAERAERLTMERVTALNARRG
jgi:DNA-binding MarR family transcriptional regulator